MEEQLEAAQVDLGGVGLDLPEVRVHGRREREVGGEPVRDVDPHAGREGGLIVERVVGVARGAGDTRRHVRNGLESARGAEPAKAGERAELAHDSVGLGQDRSPVGFLSGSELPPGEIDAPGLCPLLGRKAKLRERNPKLSRPACGVAAHARIPDRIPGAVHPAVVVDQHIALDAARTDLEKEACPVVVVRVERDHGPVALDVAVATAEAGVDRIRLGVVHTHPYVDGLAVVENSGFGSFRGRGAGPRAALDEVRRDGRRGPGTLVEVPVQMDRPSLDSRGCQRPLDGR